MTDADANPRGRPVGIRRGISQSRANLESQMVPTTGLQLSYAPRQFLARDELIMLVSSSEEASEKIIPTSAVECDIADTPHQQAAFYLSVLADFSPALLSLAKEVLQEERYTVTEVTEDTAPEYLITLEGWIKFPAALAIFGQFVLIIYKTNIDDRSYTNFMQRRMDAIKRLAGAVEELVPGKGDILLSVSTAKNIRRIVGGNSKFRAELLKVIIANRNGQRRVHSVCRYLAEIICWTEMGQWKFMYETFCLVDSPVLKDSRVEDEAKNLKEACERVSEADFPQFYRILHPDEARVTIALSRFKTLAEVARRYRNELYSAGRQLATSSNSQNTLVSDLLSLHREYMNGGHARDMSEEMSEVFRFLTTFELTARW